MEFSQAQKELDDWAGQFGEENKYWKPLSILARLIEEVGELARELNHRYGDKPKKSEADTRDIEDELGDIITTIILLSNSLNINLDEVFDKQLNKINKRVKNGWKPKDSSS